MVIIFFLQKWQIFELCHYLNNIFENRHDLCSAINTAQLFLKYFRLSDLNMTEKPDQLKPTDCEMPILGRFLNILIFWRV